jgi:hypothetical protein
MAIIATFVFPPVKAVPLLPLTPPFPLITDVELGDGG